MEENYAVFMCELCVYQWFTTLNLYTVWLSIIAFLLYLFRAWIAEERERERNGIKLVFYLQIEDIWKGKKLNIDNSQPVNFLTLGRKKRYECDIMC